MTSRTDPSPSLDPRRHPFRADLAAEDLRGRVETERFVPGHVMRCARPVVSIKGRPRRAASQTAELLFGEEFTVYETRDGWAWGQRATDGYIGYVQASALEEAGEEPGHMVAALTAPVFTRAHFKAPVARSLSINSPVRIRGAEGEFRRLSGGGWLHQAHLAARGDVAPDFVAVAEEFRGLPYIWGGNSGLGVDCSGLVQAALQRAGRPCPRDTDMQEAELGRALATRESGDFRRGDVILFPGHVGIVVAPGRLLHASSRWMRVLDEALDSVLARLRLVHAEPITAVRRIAPDPSR
jgi:cell wall-associated NlpC family hydrolase